MLVLDGGCLQDGCQNMPGIIVAQIDHAVRKNIENSGKSFQNESSDKELNNLRHTHIISNTTLVCSRRRVLRGMFALPWCVHVMYYKA